MAKLLKKTKVDPKRLMSSISSIERAKEYAKYCSDSPFIYFGSMPEDVNDDKWYKEFVGLGCEIFEVYYTTALKNEEKFQTFVKKVHEHKAKVWVFTSNDTDEIKTIKNSKNIKVVPRFYVTNIDEVNEFHTTFLKEGYEGTMIRWGNEGYKVNGRSSNLLKYKDFQDIACEVVDVVPSDKNPEQGVVHCVLNGETFGCGMKFSHKDREEILKRKQELPSEEIVALTKKYKSLFSTLALPNKDDEVYLTIENINKEQTLQKIMTHYKQLI